MKNEQTTVSPITVLPDGSACFTMSLPLPKDHWSYDTEPIETPALLRVGNRKTIDVKATRDELVKMVREATRYAWRATSGNGKIDDIDPDALVKNMVIGLLGYWTSDGHEDSDFML